jgi:catechol 2,3-dioxygenase-like lactoylglutathione lyase family enzyme
MQRSLLPIPARFRCLTGNLGLRTVGLMFRSPQVTLYSRDLPSALAFYTKLGFTEAFRDPKEGAPEHVEMLLDGFNLGIATVDTATNDHGLSPNIDGQGMELVLWTEDTDTAYARLVAEGARALSEPHDWLESLRLAWVADPDDNPIQIVQRRR